MAGRQLRDGEGKEVKMTRGADSSIKAGQRKPGLETISKLSTRGSRGEDKSWSGNKDTREPCRSPSFPVCVCAFVLARASTRAFTPNLESSRPLWSVALSRRGIAWRLAEREGPSFTSMPAIRDRGRARARACASQAVRTCAQASTWQSARSAADPTQMAESGRCAKVLAELRGRLANVPTKRRLRGPTSNMFTQIPGC